MRDIIVSSKIDSFLPNMGDILPFFDIICDIKFVAKGITGNAG